MKRTVSALVCCLALLLLMPHHAFAAEKQGKRARSLIGTPVNVNIAASGTLPKGVKLFMVNASFADKTRAKQGGGDRPDVFGQVWLFKLRYGITNQLEIGMVLPYINNSQSKHQSGSDHIEGPGDMTMQLTWAFFNQHQGDPLSLSLGVAALLPTGIYGKNHIPGNGVWGGRVVGAVGWRPTENIKLDTELAWMGPFERGNQHVKRGHQYQWNAFARYLFDNFDIGLESSCVIAESADRRFATGTRNLRNGYKEWFVGPSMNFAIDSLNSWIGVGVFFPVMQDMKGPAKVENARFDFKLGILW